MMYQTTCPSPVGDLTLASDGEGIVGLWMQGQKYFGDTLRGEETRQGDLPVLRQAVAWLDRYFGGENPAISELPLRPKGSGFRQRVWRILCEIPYGETITYGDIAGKMAAQAGRTGMSCQAVGGAVGHNPVSIIIPCHRVVGSNGSLTGFSGGIGKKLHLLRLEGADLTGLFVPKKGTAL